MAKQGDNASNAWEDGQRIKKNYHNVSYTDNIKVRSGSDLKTEYDDFSLITLLFLPLVGFQKVLRSLTCSKANGSRNHKKCACKIQSRYGNSHFRVFNTCSRARSFLNEDNQTMPFRSNMIRNLKNKRTRRTDKWYMAISTRKKKSRGQVYKLYTIKSKHQHNTMVRSRLAPPRGKGNSSQSSRCVASM